MSFRLVPKSVTLNGVLAAILRHFSEIGSFRAHCVKLVEDMSKLYATQM